MALFWKKNKSKELAKKEVKELFDKTQKVIDNANSFDILNNAKRDMVLIRAMWVLLGGEIQ